MFLRAIVTKHQIEIESESWSESKINWHKDFIQQQSMLPMRQLEAYFALLGFNDWPNAAGLNQLKKRNSALNIPNFVCQSEMPDSALYYEQIIHLQNIIPTRPNSWHDLFNALIWLQFPQTKMLLNRQHVEDIEQFGLSPRTQRRNNLTHFDECGVIVTYEVSTEFSQMIEALKQHQWQKVLVENRQVWGKQLNSFIFGHANLEMLLQPFVGLTGKWMAIEVDSQFSSKCYAEQIHIVDELVASKIAGSNIFAQKKPLHPMPLLGIPDVWEANRVPAFYQNTDYFRPCRETLSKDSVE
jgi:hypothetical protein